ncbi:unnamed protein product [Calicophoron daubneyi]|uniref:Bardet-Biedl syndrome 7 n=1 Tax=Calicophoron daubneyi TaxID=300641 RepID=A0AAV2TJL5_CALDB
MKLKMRKLEYYHAGDTHKNCAVILAPTTNCPNYRLVVADNTGEVHTLEQREVLRHTSFRVSAPVTRVHVGRNKGKERIFIAHDSRIASYSPRGKLFVEYISNVEGQIAAIVSRGLDVYYVTGCFYQKLHHLKETEFFLAADVITDILALDGGDGNEAGLVVLACRDRILRILKNGVILCEMETTGPPTCLAHAPGRLKCDHLLYGTSDGRVCFVQTIRDKVLPLWGFNSCNTTNAVLSLDHYDLTLDEEEELIVAYEDGVIEVYAYDEFGYPQIIFHLKNNMRLSAVMPGNFFNSNYPELVCVASSGLIFGLTTQPPPNEPPETDSTQQATVGLRKKLEELREEVASLEKQVSELHAAKDEAQLPMIALSPLQLEYEFVLKQDLSAYCLTVDCPVAIDHVLLQCDCPLDLLDVDDVTAIASSTPYQSPTGNGLLTTYRCQSNTTHLDLRMRTIEGQYGLLHVYVVPRGHSPVICRELEFPIRPLSLHCRTHTFVDDPARPLNKLTLTGKFSLAEMHMWLIFCLPETPDRPPIVETAIQDGQNDSRLAGDSEEIAALPESQMPDKSETARMIYSSTFLGSQLECCYQKNMAVFRSDNVSTIAILKDVLSKEATKRKIHLTIDFDIHPDSVTYMLRSIHPKFEFLLSLARQVSLIEPIRELVSSQTQSADIQMNADNPLPGSLPPEYAVIWKNAEELRSTLKQYPCQLERLYGCVVDLYIDKYRFRGIDVKRRAPQLLELLNHYDLDKVLAFFEES